MYDYMIERMDGRRCGVVRLYGINSLPPATSGGDFTWGSWILDGSKPPKAALESACLVYMVAFDHLGLSQARFDVRRGNERTLAFHRRFGAQETHADERDVFFVYPRARFDADRETHFSILRGETGK